jgi:hypothetical protein
MRCRRVIGSPGAEDAASWEQSTLVSIYIYRSCSQSLRTPHHVEVPWPASEIRAIYRSYKVYAVQR